MISVRHLFSSGFSNPTKKTERARMRQFMELHAKYVHVETCLHHEKRHMGKRHKILSSLKSSGDSRSAYLQKRIAMKKQEIEVIKETLRDMKEEMHVLACEIENTVAYKKEVKKAEKTYKIISWIEKNKADEWLLYPSALLTVVGVILTGVIFTGVDTGLELFSRVQVILPLSLFASSVGIRFIIDAKFNMLELKGNLHFLKHLPSFFVQKEHLKKEAHQTPEYA